MVTADISQLTAECTTWRATLRNSRQEITECQQRLQKPASRQLPKNVLQDIEHYENQFRIQLLNIHDLKQAIKDHERKLENELTSDKAAGENIWTTHEDLFQRYQYLENSLHELKEEFNRFIQQYP
jgi:chromosome segregation ATPase